VEQTFEVRGEDTTKKKPSQFVASILNDMAGSWRKQNCVGIKGIPGNVEI